MGNTIAELEKALEALRESEEIMRYIVRYDPNAIAIYDCNLLYIAVSERYLIDYNVKEEDIIGRHHYEVFPEMPQRWKDIHQRCLQGEILRNDDDWFERPDGSVTYNRWECRPWRRMNGEIGGMITYTEVTTARKEAELKLQESEEMMRHIVRYDPNALAVYDCEMRYIAVSERYLTDYKVKEADIIGRHHYEVFPDVPQRLKDIHQRCLQGEIFHNDDDSYVYPDGSVIYYRWECRPWRKINGETGGIISYTEVITEKKKAEILLKENEEKYRYIFANNPQPMWIYDIQTLAFLEVNDAAVAHYGYSREEFMQMTLRDIRPEEDIPQLYQNISTVASSENPPQGWRHRKKNGEIIYVEISAHSVLFGGKQARHILINDITMRKQAEDQARHISRLYAVLSQINHAIVKIKDQQELFDKICEVAVEYGQFRMAWIGTIDETGQKLTPFSQAGFDDGYISQISIVADRLAGGQGPTGQAVLEGRIITSSDIATDPRMLPWRKNALKRGYRSSAAVPFRCKGKVTGALSLYARDAGFFTDEEQSLLGKISEDISFALDAMATEQEHKQAKVELSTSEFRYRRLFESSKDAILLIDAESGIVSDVNASLTALSGYASHDFLNKPVWENLFLQQIVTDYEAFSAYKKTYGQQISEVLLKHREGDDIYMEVVFNSYPVNNRMMIQCNLRNISKRKTAELKLKEALLEAQRFRQALDHVSSYIYLKDLQSNYIYANKHTLELFGCTSDQLIGKDDYCFFPKETAIKLRQIDASVFQGIEANGEIVVNDPMHGLRVYLEVKVPIYTSEHDRTVCGLMGISTDITERKVIENRLKESEERFRTVAQGITDVIYEWDLNEKIDWYGDIDQIMECQPGEFPRQFSAFKAFLHPEDRATMVDSLDSFINKGYPHTIEYRVQKKGGQWCWWSARRTLIRGNCGEPVKVIGSVTDITERITIRNEMKFQADLLNQVGQAVIATDMEGHVTYWNLAAEKMYGWTAHEAVGKNIVDLTPTALSKEEALMIGNEIQKGNVWSGEFIVKRKDGSSFPSYVTDAPILDVSGKLVGVIGISTDITERKNSERKILLLSKAFEQTVDSIVITDRQGRIEFVNNSFESITGFKPEEVLGKTPGILKSGQYDKSFYQEMWSIILSGKVYRKEIINRKKNGELYYVEKTISPIFDQNRNITHFVGTGVDISERKRAEQELIKAKEKAEESDRLKSAFLANMSHEVRTPLNSILGFSRILADAEFHKEQRDEFIQHIINNGNQLLTIISDIIDISKIESGLINIQKAPVDAHLLITAIKDQFSLDIKGKELDLVFKRPEHCEEMVVVADLQRLNQVFTNLLSNAMKFTPQGRIEIGYQPKDKMVEFFVKDTGIGIPKEYHDKIFERFRQVEVEKTRKYGGNGLGLAITKNLVELMEGQIWLDSQPGKGSTFYFTLPLHQQ